MYPFAQQVLESAPDDADRRAAGLGLEVKGDFCHKVRSVLEACGRAADHLEVSLERKYRYNPLHNDLEAYALAYGIASLLNNLFGKEKEPFWQQAYTNLVKSIILLHETLYGYVTLFDVYECAINQNRLAQRIADGEQTLAARYLLLDIDTYLERTELDEFEWERDDNAQCIKSCMKSPYLKERAHLVSKGIAFDLLPSAGEDMWDALRMCWNR
jgi:hypothetical protein